VPASTLYTKPVEKKTKDQNNSGQSIADAQSETIQDNRPAALAQMKIARGMGDSPNSKETTRLQAMMASRTPVQRAADEEEVQMKAAPIQKVADEEEVQMKAAPIQLDTGDTNRETIIGGDADNEILANSPSSKQEVDSSKQEVKELKNILSNEDHIRNNIYEKAKGLVETREIVIKGEVKGNGVKTDSSDEEQLVDAAATAGFTEMQQTLQEAKSFLQKQEVSIEKSKIFIASLTDFSNDENRISKTMSKAFLRNEKSFAEKHGIELHNPLEIGNHSSLQQNSEGANNESAGDYDNPNFKTAEAFKDGIDTSGSGAGTSLDESPESTAQENGKNPFNKFQNDAMAFFKKAGIKNIKVDPEGLGISADFAPEAIGIPKEATSFRAEAKLSAEIPIWPGVGASLSTGIKTKLSPTLGSIGFTLKKAPPITKEDFSKLLLKEQKLRAERNKMVDKGAIEGLDILINANKEEITTNAKKLEKYNNSVLNIEVKGGTGLKLFVEGYVQAGLFAGMPGLNVFGGIKGSLLAEAKADLFAKGNISYIAGKGGFLALDGSLDYGFKASLNVGAEAAMTAGYNIGPFQKTFAEYKLGTWPIAAGSVEMKKGDEFMTTDWDLWPDPPIEGDLAKVKEGMAEIEKTGGTSDELERLKAANESTGMFDMFRSSKEIEDKKKERVGKAQKDLEEKETTSKSFNDLGAAVNDEKYDRCFKDLEEKKILLAKQKKWTTGLFSNEAAEKTQNEIMGIEKELLPILQELKIDTATLKKLEQQMGKQTLFGKDLIAQTQSDIEKLESNFNTQGPKYEGKLKSMMTKNNEVTKQLGVEGFLLARELRMHGITNFEDFDFEGTINETNKNIENEQKICDISEGKSKEESEEKIKSLKRILELAKANEDKKQVLLKNENVPTKNLEHYEKKYKAAEIEHKKVDQKIKKYKLKLAEVDKCKRELNPLKKKLEIYKKEYTLIQIGAK
jgi:hypothetical protein